MPTLLDLERGGHEGFRDPATMGWEEVVRALHDGSFFMNTVAPGTSVPYGAIPALQDAWRDSFGLVDGDDLQRLVWELQRFGTELEVDLRWLMNGTDLGELWRARRWRLLLNLLDHLPRASWTHQAQANDPERAERMAKALAARPASDAEEATRSMVENTPEVAMLADLIDVINAGRMDWISANSNGKRPNIPSYPRPLTLASRLVARVRREVAWQAHEKLADRLLSKRQAGGE